MAKTLYPEIEVAGGLSLAINSAFEKVGSEIRVSGDNNSMSFPVDYSRIEKDEKFSQVYIAAEEKLYLPDFWRDGVCLAHGCTSDIKLLVECIDYWLTNEVDTSQLADKFPFVTPKDNAHVFDKGNEVEYSWQELFNDPDRLEIKSFVKLAMKENVLSKLFPYTSLMTLCFSRCTGYPFTYDTPNVTPIYATDQYLVRASNGIEIGSGSADEALKMVLNNLPKDIGPAVKGTSECL